jgi:hypothetical protein
MRIFRVAAMIALAIAATGCGYTSSLFRPYEYEEDVYLSLDGTATVYVNSSIAALDALRGAPFDPDPHARVDRDAVRRYYTTPFTRVASVTDSRRSGRRFVHVRLEVQDIRQLGDAAPFAWSVYDLHRDEDRYIYRQALGAAAGRVSGNPGWTGKELVAFRLHLPSRIEYHNAGVGNFKRGNILVWEQPLADRLRSVPLVFDAQMRTQSILYSALALFGLTCVAVAVMFGVVVVWVRRSGAAQREAPDGAGKAGRAGRAG